MKRRVAFWLLTIVTFIGLLLTQRPAFAAVSSGPATPSVTCGVGVMLSVSDGSSGDPSDDSSGSESVPTDEISTLDESPVDGEDSPPNAEGESDEPFSVPRCP